MVGHSAGDVFSTIVTSFFGLLSVLTSQNVELLLAIAATFVKLKFYNVDY